MLYKRAEAGYIRLEGQEHEMPHPVSSAIIFGEEQVMSIRDWWLGFVTCGYGYDEIPEMSQCIHVTECQTCQQQWLGGSSFFLSFLVSILEGRQNGSLVTRRRQGEIPLYWMKLV